MVPQECTPQFVTEHLEELLKEIKGAKEEDAQYMRALVNKILMTNCFYPEVMPLYERFLNEVLGINTKKKGSKPKYTMSGTSPMAMDKAMKLFKVGTEEKPHFVVRIPVVPATKRTTKAK
jgi:hypothetical protein